MGCDIHLYREKRVDGKWVTADEWKDEYDEGTLSVPFDKRFHDRNYNLFAVLAGVREREAPVFKFEPRGMPLGASAEVAAACEQWDGDGHSHSYLYLHELQDLAALMAASKFTISGMKNSDELAVLRESIDSGAPDWDLLYPYCQGTNDPKQVEFSIEVPADFVIGGALKKLIDGLSEIGGEQQRIVFWFDN